MSLFGSNYKQSQIEFEAPVYEGYVAPTLTGIQEINAEAQSQAYAFESALYVADIFMEESVMEGTATPEALMESVIKDSFAKIKQALKDFWAKIKAWFNQVKTMITALFLSGKKLVEKFKKELDSTKKGFEYKGFHWTLTKGGEETTNVIAKIEKYIEDTAGVALKDIDSASNLRDSMKDKAPSEDEVDTSADSEKLVELIGGGRKELVDELSKAFRNNEDSKDTFENFSGNSKAELIELVKNGQKIIADLKKSEKSTDKGFQATLRTIQRAEKLIDGGKAEGDSESKRKAQMVKATNRLYSVAKEAISYMNTASGVQVSSTKAAVSASTGVLRSYISYRPKKEGFGDEFEGTSTSGSLLESAFRSL